MGVRNSILLRIRIAFVIVGLFALGILYQVGKLQSVDGAKWREVSRTSGFSFREVEATRGDVLSDDGRLLASSLPFYQVALDPTQAPDSIFFSKKLDSLAAHLSHFFGEQDTTYYVEMLTQARADTNRYKMLSRKTHQLPSNGRDEDLADFQNGSNRWRSFISQRRQAFPPIRLHRKENYWFCTQGFIAWEGFGKEFS